MAGPNAHVKRIYAINPDGSFDTDVWIDVLRTDTLPTTRRGRADGRTETSTAVLFWKDATEENANDKRSTTLTKVTNPTDSTQSIDLWTVEAITLANWGKGDGQSHQNTAIVFDQRVATNTSRRTTQVRVPHNDLASLIDMTRGPVDWADYQTALAQGTRDTSQYLDVEMTNAFTLNLGGEHDGLNGQHVVFDLTMTKDVAALFPPSDAANPVQTDPLQTIVNVSWVVPLHFLASTGQGMLGSKDGISWFLAPQSVFVMSLAWAGGAWIGFNTFFDQVFMSYDGAQTWRQVFSISGVFGGQVAAIQVKGQPPLFAVWGATQSLGGSVVFISSNYGQTWVPTLQIQEKPVNLTGAGDGFYFTAQMVDSSSGETAAILYKSVAGGAWSASTVFGPGGSDQIYNAGGVGYDPKSKSYILTGSLAESGTYYLIYSIWQSPYITGPLGFGQVVLQSPGADPVTDFRFNSLMPAGGGGGFAVAYFTGGGENLGDQLAEYGLTLPGVFTLLVQAASDFHGVPCDHTCFAGKNPGLFGIFAVSNSFSGIFMARPGGAFGLSLRTLAFTVDPNTTYIGAAMGAGVCKFLPP